MAFITADGALSLSEFGYGPFFTGLAILAAPDETIPVDGEFLLVAIDKGVLSGSYIYQSGKLVDLAGNSVNNGEGYRLGFVAGPVDALLKDADLRHLKLRSLRRKISLSGNVSVSQLYALSEPIPIPPEIIEVPDAVTYLGEIVTFNGDTVVYDD